ncbi:MAG: hypothetical protein KHY27_07420, partial [Butyricicoccus pullicaecorum]|nr:hypothetical protein [Butyricicoccus pullicaecorum]
MRRRLPRASQSTTRYVCISRRSVRLTILALFTEKSTASQILKDAGVTEKELRQAIEELR